MGGRPGCVSDRGGYRVIPDPPQGGNGHPHFPSSQPAKEGTEVRCPGMGEHRSRKENLKLGIPVNEKIHRLTMAYLKS